MSNPDYWRPEWQDPARAFGLLTRLPIRVDGDAAQARGAQAAWAYPLVGIGVGAFTSATLGAALWLGLPALVAAALALGLSLFVTGASHEDGLADTLDGLWGGWTRQRRLEIMKDSRIGAYGVIGLVLGLVTKLGLLAEGPSVWMILAAAVGSRAAMVGLMGLQPHARTSGLSHAVGTPDRRALMLALVIGGTSVAFFSITALSIAAAVALGIALIARAKIGGQTGDILGATQVIVELAILATLIAQA